MTTTHGLPRFKALLEVVNAPKRTLYCLQVVDDGDAVRLTRDQVTGRERSPMVVSCETGSSLKRLELLGCLRCADVAVL